LRAGQGYAKSQAMPTDQPPPTSASKPSANDAAANPAGGKRKPSPAAERALAEAAARRAKCAGKTAGQPKELQGRDGPEPTRYGDWEKDGLTSDF